MGEDQTNGVGQAGRTAQEEDERRGEGQARGDCQGTLEESKGGW